MHIRSRGERWADVPIMVCSSSIVLFFKRLLNEGVYYFCTELRKFIGVYLCAAVKKFITYLCFEEQSCKGEDIQLDFIQLKIADSWPSTRLTSCLLPRKHVQNRASQLLSRYYLFENPNLAEVKTWPERAVKTPPAELSPQWRQ